ncbi:MAG: ADP-forming succinate--CoA ligase subunit beta [Chloroflexi bacterium]|nr:ADP-forming succinate--CoA ligase subunit beta [Chloroflexota bacterium]
MKIHEYQAKQLLARYGIPVPPGEVAYSPGQARDIARRLGCPVVVKAQVLVGGRGKAGGVRLVSTPDDAEEVAKKIFSLHIKGSPVRKVLVAQAASVAQELYLGATLDRVTRRLVLIASSQGGVDIEEVAARAPEKIAKVFVDPFIGFSDYLARDLAFEIQLPPSLLRDFATISRGLIQAFVEVDASLVEINPLAITAQGQLWALDAKIVLDDNGLFRHKDLEALRDPDEEDPYERQARENELSYVKLDGRIGCMVNGAGLSMATMDVIKLYGGAPANFLDIGGGAKADKVAVALRIILSDSNVKAVLFNIFGGITRCDEVARGIIAALDEVRPDVPMVARLVGTNEAEGRALLSRARMITATTLQEAAQKVVEVAR